MLKKIRIAPVGSVKGNWDGIRRGHTGGFKATGDILLPEMWVITWLFILLMVFQLTHGYKYLHIFFIFKN